MQKCTLYQADWPDLRFGQALQSWSCRFRVSDFVNFAIHPANLYKICENMTILLRVSVDFDEKYNLLLALRSTIFHHQI